MIIAALLMQSVNPYDQFSTRTPEAPCLSGAAECDPWERDWTGISPAETAYIALGEASDHAFWSIQELAVSRARTSTTQYRSGWVRVDYPAIPRLGYRRGLYLYTADCLSEMIGVQHITRYTASGAVELDHENPPAYAHMVSIVPGTMLSIVRHSLCGA